MLDTYRDVQHLIGIQRGHKVAATAEDGTVRFEAYNDERPRVHLMYEWTPEEALEVSRLIADAAHAARRVERPRRLQ